VKIPIQLPNPPEGYKPEAFIVAMRVPEIGDWLLGLDGKLWECSQRQMFFFTYRPILQLQKIAVPKPVIEELLVETDEYGRLCAQGYTLCELMTRADFRGFTFDGVSKPWALPCGWVNKKGEIMAHKLEDSDRFVHASHVLREVDQ
tara:strand:+ start:161 stop:598 length:438 start_codon:yes stop_codon:yes gene_type:complete